MARGSPLSSANASTSFSNGPTETSTACRSFMRQRKLLLFGTAFKGSEQRGQGRPGSEIRDKVERDGNSKRAGDRGTRAAGVGHFNGLSSLSRVEPVHHRNRE